MNFNNIDINSQLNSIFKKKKYSLGFLFSASGELVCLIQKEKPEWQKGCLNGVGGKVEEGETFIECMIREFQEETGVFIQDWIESGKIVSNEYEVMVYCSFNDKINEVSSITDEEVIIVSVFNIGISYTIRNVPVLVEMCLDREIKSFILQY